MATQILFPYQSWAYQSPTQNNVVPVWAWQSFMPRVNYQNIVNTPVNQLYSDYAQQYKQTNPLLYNQLTSIANDYDDIYNRWSNQLSALSQWYNQQLDTLYKPYFDTSAQIWSQYAQSIQPLLQDVSANYWPWGTLRSRTDDFYKNLYGYLNTKSAEQQARVASQAEKSWASLQQILAWQNEVLSRNMEDYIKAQQNSVSQLDNILKSYQTMELNLRDRLKQTQDQNILKPLEWITNAKNQIALELYKSQQALLSAQLSDAIAKKSVQPARRQTAYTWQQNTTQQNTTQQNNNKAILDAYNILWQVTRYAQSLNKAKTS